jgi:hypothetical protein
VVPIGFTFDDFNFVVDSFQFTGMNGVVTVIEDPVSVTFNGFGKLGDCRVSYRTGEGAPLIDGLVGPCSRCIGPEVFEFLLEDHDDTNGFVQFQELLQMLSVSESSDVGPIFQQQVLGTFDDSFMSFACFFVLAISDLIDDTVELGDDMKQVEDNGHMGNFLSDGQNEGVPHIHGDGFEGFSLFFRHTVKKPFESSGFAVFSHPDHSSCQVIENHCQKAMSLANGDFVHGQQAKSFVIGLPIFLFQKPFVDGFDGFPIQSQMFGNLFDCYHPAQLIDIEGQSPGDPEIGIEQIQVFDEDLLTLGTNDLAIVTTDRNPGGAEVEIPDLSLVLTVNASPPVATAMTNRMKSLVWDNLDQCLLCFRANPLFDNTNSWKRQIWCNTQCGHSGPPLDKGFSNQNNSYPLEVPDVLFC